MPSKRIFLDKIHMRLRLFEAFFGLLVLLFLLFSDVLEEAGYSGVFALVIPVAIILDGLFRYRVVRKGILVDETAKKIGYPYAYVYKEIPLCEIRFVRSSKTRHSGAQFGSSTYSYDIVLEGSFGRSTIIFASAHLQNEVKNAIKESIEHCKKG